MDNEIVIALLALVGTAIGTAGGIITSSKLTNFRIKQLEQKVDKHNTVIERTYRLEERVRAVERSLSE